MRATTLVLVSLAILDCGPCIAQTAPQLTTVAELSQWRATARHAQVLALIDQLEHSSQLVSVVEMGKTSEGRSIPMLILADPKISTAAQARASGKLVVYAQGGIHSGECCGKEALLILARELISTKRELLQNLVVLITPLYNGDGNERVSKSNRPGQNGPEEGMGQRATAQGYDLNRDNTKLDSPEAQSLSRMMNEWDPWLFIDTHTTNGSYHRNSLTFEGPVNPAGDPELMDFVRKRYLPTVSQRLEKRKGWLTTWYGNFNRDHSRWTSYDGRPRFGTRARGIRGIVSILSEAYTYASYKDRVLCTRDFVEELLRYASENPAQIKELIRSIRKKAIKAGMMPRADDRVALRTKQVRSPKDLVIPGWVERVSEGSNGRRALPTEKKRDYPVEHWGESTATLSVRRPFAYVFPASMTKLRDKLAQHGIQTHKAKTELNLVCESYRIDEIKRARRPFQKHRINRIEVSTHSGSEKIPAGSIIVPTAQPLGNFIVYLLEPQSEDGLAAWNLLDEQLEVKKDYPLRRVLKPFRF